MKPYKYKDIVMETLLFLVKKKRIILFTFVIMGNHLHRIWQLQTGIKPEDVQRDLYINNIITAFPITMQQLVKNT
jgi:putative transposase